MKSTYQIDPAHSNVQFSIRHLMISNVRGVFSGVTGTVVFDPDNLTDSSIHAEVDVASINTLDEKRDAHLKSPDFFESEKYPKMTFVSKSIEKTGGSDYRVTGDLTIHGVTKETVLTVEDVAPEGKDPWGNTRTGAAIRGKINRKDFGLSWNGPVETGGVLIGEDVKLELDVQLVKSQSVAA